MKGTVIMILAYAPRGEPGRALPYSTNNGKAALCMPTPKAVKKGHYNCMTDIVSAVMGGGYYTFKMEGVRWRIYYVKQKMKLLQRQRTA